jgi:hypothetical protein
MRESLDDETKCLAAHVGVHGSELLDHARNANTENAASR